ncbi:MAG: N-6 DNA methylase [Fuerstiella sp.]
MSRAPSTTWQEQFGLDRRRPPEFFSGGEGLPADAPQAHLVQRGFDDLSLDGVLCTTNTPLVYFRRVSHIDADSVAALYRSFWHHGGAPVLVIVSDDEVHVYSGLTLPQIDSSSSGLVAKLNRVTDDLQEFLLSVESGEFFHANRQFFNPEHRVDRALLSNLRESRKQLNDLSQRDTPASVLDSLICRLVFTAYLFDRGVIGEQYLRSAGIDKGDHLRDVLAIVPTGQAKTALYQLFERLAEDFNGDLFADNLNSESRWIVNRHIEVLAAFFHGTDVKTGQQSFWPYDFGTIPVETISAIYEHFLKDSDKQAGAFYTPRFLAEIVLDVALDDCGDLTSKTFLDPACGSGIFLVGVFNRIAQQWRHSNPRARHNTVARELMRLIQECLFGVDVNPTACRIAAFSLYLAYLDQFSPRDIQELQEKGRALPNLVSDESTPRNITCADFFDESANLPQFASVVVGNPPWGSIAGDDTPAGVWASENDHAIPDKQIASAFIRKATDHVDASGSVCFVLPAGVLFNHSEKAIEFQKSWVTTNTLECVLNLADYQRFLFEVAGYPAIVARYRPKVPEVTARKNIDYWSPKSDWSVTKAEVIRIASEDRVKLSLDEVVDSLSGDDAPQIWKRHFWATPRDRRLLDRLSDLPRLRSIVRQTREKSDKPWIIAQGFQPLGPGDDRGEAKRIQLQGRTFIEATSDFDLVLNERDCDRLQSASVEARRHMRDDAISVFAPPHVLVTRGFSNAAFADFYCSFRSSVRGIHGPQEDAALLAFLAAYLRSSIARYFLFHTSSNWGVTRAEVQDEELLKLPFPLAHAESGASHDIVEDVAAILRGASKAATKENSNRAEIVKEASRSISPLIDHYFGITDSERDLINDTINIAIPSTRPTRSRLNVPTVKSSSSQQRDAYVERLSGLLSEWAKRGTQGVRGYSIVSEKSGVGLAVLEKVDRSAINEPMHSTDDTLVETLARLREIASRKHVAIELVRGIKIFDRNRLYIVKSLDQRNWTLTSAMNDADEIAGSLLMNKAAAPV